MELLSMIPYTAHENVFTREFLKWSMRSVFVVGAGVFIFRRRNDKVRIFLCVLAFILCTPHLLLEISLWKYRWLIPAMIFACILYSTFLCELMQPLQKSTTIGKHARLSLVSLILFGIPLLAWKGAENCRLITSRSTAQMNAVIPDIHGMNSSGMPACEMVIELQRRHGIFDEALFVENAEFALDPMFHIKDHTYHWIKNVANDNIRFSEIIPTR